MDDININAKLVWIKTPGIAWKTAVTSKIICPVDKCRPVFSVPNTKFPLQYCFGVYCKHERES